jgi:hypothetical protein
MSGFLNGRDHSNKEVEPDAIALLQAGSDRFSADSRDAHVAFRVVRELIVHVVRELAVDADRLEFAEYGFA